MPVGTYRVQSPGFPKIVYSLGAVKRSLERRFHKGAKFNQDVIVMTCYGTPTTSSPSRLIATRCGREAVTGWLVRTSADPATYTRKAGLVFC